MSGTQSFKKISVLGLMFLVGCQGYKAREVVGQCSASEQGTAADISVVKTQLERVRSVPSLFSSGEDPTEDPADSSREKIQKRFLRLAKHVQIQRGEELTAVINANCLDQPQFAQASLANVADTKKISSTRGSVSVPVRARFDQSVAELEQNLQDDSCVTMVSDRVLMKKQARPNDRSFNMQMHLSAIRAASAWDIFYGSRGIAQEVVFAIIDTGVSLRHDDLRAGMWVNTREIAGNRRDDDGNGYVDDINGYNFADGVGRVDVTDSDSNYHGTHVAGLAAARMNNQIGGSGVMGASSKIMSLNVFGTSDGAQNEDIENAIRYAADNGAHVINLSLGGSGRVASTYEALKYAVQKGVTVFAAAGNDGNRTDTRFFSPAGYAKDIAGMISVGSVDSTTFYLSSFSNYGPLSVEFSAPGNIGIYSTVPLNGYASIAGTSMASPVAAGAGGLTLGYVWSRTGTRPSPALVESLLLGGAKKLSGLRNYVKAGATLDLRTLAESLQTYVSTRSRGSAAEGPVPIADGTESQVPSGPLANCASL